MITNGNAKKNDEIPNTKCLAKPNKKWNVKMKVVMSKKFAYPKTWHGDVLDLLTSLRYQQKAYFQSLFLKKKNNEPPQNGLPSLSLEWLSSHNSKHSTESPKTATFFTKLHRFIVAGTI